jgi:iron complex outermembrane receptor protein
VFVSVAGQGLQPRQQGTFPNGSEVAQAFGIPSLTAEKSLNYSVGVTSQPLSNLSITVDAYQIDINDRIVLTGQFARGTSGIGPQVAQILDDAGQREVNAAVFFTNAVSTRTQGVDIVMASDFSVATGNLTLTLAGNINQTKVQGEPKVSETLPADVFGNALFNRQERARLEWAQPRNKFTLGAAYRIGKFGTNIRVTRFGEVKVFDISNPVLDETYTPKAITDISFSYQITNFLQATVGANNLFDVYPDQIQVKQYPRPGDPTNLDNSSFGRFVYSRGATQFGFNGGYYFVNLSARF